MDTLAVVTPGRFRLGRISVAAFAVALALLCVDGASAQDLRGKVVRVADGDTITVLLDRHPVPVRLNGIDAPERGQAFGRKAREFTAKLALHNEVTIRGFGQDRFRRTLGEVYLPDGRSLNHELVRAGYAWWFRRYSKDGSLAELESQARAKRVGLWADSHPVPPWEWRQLHQARGKATATSAGELELSRGTPGPVASH
jgi:endonuclease YncB( thermonuclease family)